MVIKSGFCGCRWCLYCHWFLALVVVAAVAVVASILDLPSRSLEKNQQINTINNNNNIKINNAKRDQRIENHPNLKQKA